MSIQHLILHKGLKALRIVLISILVSSFPLQNAIAIEKLVVLNTAVSPILKEIGMGEAVVGVTFNDETYTNRTKVGSHLSPNVELIKALQPDLMIVGSKRAFPERLKDRFGTEIYRYDPENLEDILNHILKLGVLFEKESRSGTLVLKLRKKLSQFQKPGRLIPVAFEISQRPLKMAGHYNIVTSMIAAAGGRNIVTIEQKHVLISPEQLLVNKPELYIYQNGPMNKNPVPPKDRNYFKRLDTEFWEVDQKVFTRPGINVFDAVIVLNQKLRSLE